jgi:CMP-N-acetylneuraminic acid synthetase
MIQKKYKCIALIPARSGSKRIKNKNIRLLGDHPLISYTIACAIDSGIFSKIVVSTDSKEIASIARYYGAKVPIPRPKRFAHDLSPDIEWIRHILRVLISEKADNYCFAILRPTSPFRKPETIRRAWRQFNSEINIDSLRAVEPCRQHPAKMWLIEKNRMKPLLSGKDKKGNPWHSKPYQSLPLVYAQNASLEIAWCSLPLEKNTISGEKIMPFLTDSLEGYDINDEKDWIYAETLIKEKKVKLPAIRKKPYDIKN